MSSAWAILKRFIDSCIRFVVLNLHLETWGTLELTSSRRCFLLLWVSMSLGIIKNECSCPTLSEFNFIKDYFYALNSLLLVTRIGRRCSGYILPLLLEKDRSFRVGNPRLQPRKKPCASFGKCLFAHVFAFNTNQHTCASYYYCIAHISTPYVCKEAIVVWLTPLSILSSDDMTVAPGLQRNPAVAVRYNDRRASNDDAVIYIFAPNLGYKRTLKPAGDDLHLEAASQ